MINLNIKQQHNKKKKTTFIIQLPSSVMDAGGAPGPRGSIRDTGHWLGDLGHTRGNRKRKK